MKDNLFSALIGVIIWAIIIIAVCVFFLYQAFWIGPVMVILAILILLSIKLFHSGHHGSTPDILFGAIDNGVLVIFAIIGLNLFGPLGAVIGGAVGNAVSDGFAGVFEGHISQKHKKTKYHRDRSSIRASFGKMAGCLLGSGIVLIIARLIMVIV
ncbi:MAG: hypothetical protein JSW08_02755 [archaeon]|nr:MAG: hypothetical protein JSW08_02755 [archaeon]